MHNPDYLTLGLLCQKLGSPLLDLRMRERLVRHASFHYRPRKGWPSRLPESKHRGSAKQSAEEVKELHLQSDQKETASERPTCYFKEQQQYLNTFSSDGIDALGP